ncbi:GNAT family N-acetyltransferase [Marinobacter sp. CHS3-4]|uniref:tRNA(Met) cytidine acetyltransferase TmcA n=1 Tax=Marinobacter sp. CHS3-4 TaxID=3045174 RepID=UPI0024B621E9|nr:GNAT family N-acetyltransferase [Marinobacter sp. CHS3-4]MDI9244041.1 GNAT family N-acetyltransferase [Marinobacter sp. CHS3-4]
MTHTVGLTDAANWRQFQDHLRNAGHRRLIVLEGDRDSAVAWLTRVLPGLSISAGVWVGTEAAPSLANIETIPAKHARRFLGQELDCLIWDGWQGNPPDGLAALAGTLTAGSLMFWLMPPVSDWSKFDDPDYRRVGLDGGRTHRFLGRISEVVAEDESVIRLNPGQKERIDLPSVPVPDIPFQVGTTEAQARLVEDIVKTGLGRRRRPLVITADRGRGKSAALGMAAARMIAEGRRQVLVTASEAGAVDTLMRHADPAVAAGGVQFLPVPELLEQRPEAEVVLVDEAASIPPYLLKKILLGWPRVVFATTIHGYEGAGRGFSVRFRQVLDAETPHWKRASLNQPIRWSDTDPLEPLISRLFLLNAEAAELPSAPDFNQSNLTIERWDPAAADDAELGKAFGLLVDAHYRTTPGDLRQWMDDPEAVTWLAKVHGVIVGVLWATREGGLDEVLANEVMLGRRRIRGHLLPQSLASHSGFAMAATQRLLRVVRVAVTSDVRQQGIGSALVQKALDYAGANQLDAVGTSFGGTAELVSFWQRAGLEPVRLGLTREASSGEVPLQMLSGVSESGIQLTRNLRHRFGEHWLVLIPRLWPDLDPALLLKLTASLNCDQMLNEDDLRDLNSFAFGFRGFDLTLPVLKNLTMSPGAVQYLLDGPDRALSALWVKAVLQGWDWQQLRHAEVCLGREEGERQCRLIVQNLLQNRPDL